MRISDWSSDVCSSDLRKTEETQPVGGVDQALIEMHNLRGRQHAVFCQHPEASAECIGPMLERKREFRACRQGTLSSLIARRSPTAMFTLPSGGGGQESARPPSSSLPKMRLAPGGIGSATGWE